MTDLIRFLLGTGWFIWSLAGIGVFFLLIFVLKSFIKVNFPNKILVVTGRKSKKQGRVFGFSVERGRTSRIPYFHQVNNLDLGVLPINVKVEGVNSANGITVGADATACVCIDNDTESMLYSAVERLMGKSRNEIKDQIQQTLVGNFRGALNKATPLQAIGMEELIDEGRESITETPPEESSAEEKTPAEKALLVEGDRAHFRNELLEDINSDLSSFGMKVVSVSLQKIWDTSNYIANLAQKTLAEKRQEVEIEEARLIARADQAESDSDRRVNVASNKANERIVKAQEKLEKFRRASTAQIEQAKLEADNGIQEAQNRGERDIQELTVELNKLKNQSMVILQSGAKQKAAEIIAEGEQEAVTVIESTRNDLLQQKVKLLAHAGDTGKIVLFIQQQLPHLFEAYEEYAKNLKVDSLVIMDDKKGFNGAVNRGPAAFVDFLKNFKEGMGIDVARFLKGKSTEEVSE